MFNWFKKKKKVQPTIEYIEQKYGIKLTFPFQWTNFKDMSDPFYDELKSFGCSDIWHGSCYLHRDCRKCQKYSIDIKTGETKFLSDNGCSFCNFYPIVQEYYDSNDIKKIRLKKLNRLNEQNPE